MTVKGKYKKIWDSYMYTVIILCTLYPPMTVAGLAAKWENSPQWDKELPRKYMTVGRRNVSKLVSLN